MIELASLSTERRNPRTMGIDELDTLSVLELMNSEDSRTVAAVHAVLPEIARAVEVIAVALRQGGRLFYLGAGTSGRLGILDAVECPPTFGTEPDMVQGVLAGGVPAIFRAQEGAEDSEDLAVDDLVERQFSPQDVLVGLAASGRTPYVIGGLRYARKIGAKTIAVSCSTQSRIGEMAEIAITAVPGPEVITGSTRLKAGTVQKLILNMLSTATMIKLGKVYGNLMVDVKITNEKLRERAHRIVMEATGCDRTEAGEALGKAGGSAKLAILCLLAGKEADEARELLDRAEGKIRIALELAGK